MLMALKTTRNDTTTSAAASATTNGLAKFIGRDILPPIVTLPLLRILMGIVPLPSIIHPGVVECLPLIIGIATALAISMLLPRFVPAIIAVLLCSITGVIPALISVVLSISLLISYILVPTLMVLLVLALLLLPVIALCRIMRAHHIVHRQWSGADISTNLLGSFTAVARIAFHFYQSLQTLPKDSFRFSQQA